MSDTLNQSKCGWKEMTLGDAITLQRGHDLPKSKMRNGKFPVAGSNGIIGWHDEPTTKGIGITIGRSGNLGNAYLYKNDFWAHNTTLYVKDFKGNDEYFIYYFLKTFDFKSFNVGSAVPTLNRNHIHPIEIKLPPLEEQKSIASVLSSLDDKIDLLHRQNQTLEQMAETLFRQWFVKNPNPEWEERPLSDFFQLLGGFAFKSKDYLEVGKYKVITIKGVQDGYLDSNSAARLDMLPEKIKTYQILNTGDILMSLTGNVGRVCLVDEEYCLLNQRVAKIEPINRKWKAFAYFYFRQNEMIERLTYLSKGSAQLNLSPVETLAQTEHFADDGLIDNYCELVNPFLSKIITNKTQIRTLTALRDTLLPKLMSGEVRVGF